jgi:16S rRNA (uracil1498-N3)-methyltransferase
VTEQAWCAAAGAAAHVYADGPLADTLDVAGDDGHHLQRVRRLRAGEVVTAADGRGNWRAYAVGAVTPGRLELRATGPARVEPALEPSVGVAIALTKGGIDQVVARCTELGVDRIELVRTRRSVVRWDESRADTAITRLRVVVREAGAQCRRARVPDVAPVADLTSLAGRPGLCVADRAGVPADALAPPGAAGFTVLVGPEGGFDPDELLALGPALPRLAVGPYVLRAETAPIAVVAALRSAWAAPNL